MIVKTVNLETVCGPTSRLPETAYNQVAFAGRSNVGKSSLINTLTGRKSLARTSSQPGKTQTINFYNVNDEIYFVDLPGYGYAKASKKAQEEWAIMIEKYLKRTPNLKAVVLLVDIRHEAKASDKVMYEWIAASGLDAVVVATKADKISKGAVAKQLKILREGLGLAPGTVMIPFSSETKTGKDQVLAEIEKFI